VLSGLARAANPFLLILMSNKDTYVPILKQDYSDLQFLNFSLYGEFPDHSHIVYTSSGYTQFTLCDSCFHLKSTSFKWLGPCPDCQIADFVKLKQD